MTQGLDGRPPRGDQGPAGTEERRRRLRRGLGVALGHAALPWTVLGVGLLLSALAGGWVGRVVSGRQDDRFQLEAGEVRRILDRRLALYDLALRGGTALFNASGPVSRDAWHRYVESLEIGKKLPGVQGIGYSQVVLPADVLAHERAVRAEGFPGYAVQPPGERPLYTSIVYLKPFDWRNQRAFGYDMWSEPVRRDAMARARDSGGSTISGTVKLVQETDTDVQPGFLMYAPVYRRGVATETVEGRRTALQGFVYSPFRVDDLMDSTFKGRFEGIAIELYDGPEAAPGRRFYPGGSGETSRDGGRAVSLPLNVGGRPWTVRVLALAGHHAPLDSFLPLSISFGGALASLLLCLNLRSVARTRREAERLAGVMTEELRASEERNRTLVEVAPDAIVVIDERGVIQQCNPAGEALFGYEAAELVGRNVGVLMSEPDRSGHDGHLARYLATGERQAGGGGRDVRARCKDGRMVTAHLRIGEQRAGDGRVRFIGFLRDLSERLRAQEALAERQALLHGLVQTTGDGVLVTDLETRILEVNDAYCHLSGYSRDELLLTSSRALVAEAVPQEVQTERLARILREGSLLFETRHRRRDGSVWPVEASVTFSVVQGGRLIAFCRDIGERKRVEEVTARAAQYARSLLESSLDPLVAISPEGRITDVNRATEAVTGRSRDQLVGSDFSDCFSEPERARAGYRQAFSEGSVTDYALSIRGTDGRLTEVLYNASVYRNADGEVEGVFAAARDVTERRRVERDLARHRESLEQVIAERTAELERTHRQVLDSQHAMDHAGIGVVWTSPDDVRIVHASRAAATLLGYSQAEFLELRIPDIAPDYDAAGVEAVNRTVIEKGFLRLETRWRHRDGRRIPVDLTLYHMESADDGTRRIIAFVVDASERHAAQESLREREERMRLALEVSRTFDFEWEPVTDVVRRTAACSGILGLEGEEAERDTGRRFFERVHPDDRAGFVAQLEALRPGADRYQTRYRLLRGDGTEAVLSESARAFFDGEGRVVRLVGATTDVTEQVRSVRALDEAERRFQRMAETMSDVFWMSTLDASRILYVSPAAETLWGKTPAELVENPGLWTQQIHPEDLGRLGEAQRAIARGEPFDIEFRLVRPGRETVWIRDRGFPVRDAAGGLACATGLCSDVTARKEAEAALGRQAARAQALLGLAALADRESDGTGFLQDGLQVAEELSGSTIGFVAFVHDDQQSVEPAAWSRHTLETYCHATSARHYPVAQAGLWADAVRTRAPVLVNDYPAFEEKKGLPEGHAGLARFVSVPVIENGRVVLVFAVGNRPEPYSDFDVETLRLIANDVWRVVQRQRTLRQLHVLSQAIEQADESIFITDAEARIEYANQAFVRETGYTLAEVRGQTPGILGSGQTPPETFAALREALHQGRSFRRELSNRRKDGTEVTVLATISPVHQADGRITHFVAVQQDVTAQKETQRALRDARRTAEEASRAKGEFLANMSHEIRTPLTAVLGLARIGARDANEPASRRAFDQILRSGGHLLGVINDVLDFSKIEAGKLTLKVLPMRLGEVVPNAVSFVAGQAREKGLTLEVTGVPADPVWVSGDAQRLQQILTNLLSNAVKFTSRGGVHLTVSREGDLTSFRVSDTGCGMTAAQIAALFAPFSQGDSSLTREQGGTGLGLAISRRLARLMGGEISVASRPGIGSDFTLSVPLPAASGPEREAPAAAEGRSLEGIRLLAAEDVDVNRLVLDDLLVKAGASVVFAGNGLEAVERVAAGPDAFDVVLMDVQMPVMDGYEATRRIRQLAPGLPVIGLTAHVMEEEHARVIASGMVEHVGKPIERDELVAAVLRHRPPGVTAGAVQTGPLRVRESPRARRLVDWPRVEQRFGESDGLVDWLVRMTLEGHRDKPDLLRAAAGAGRLEDVAFLVHSLHGVAGNLEARPLLEEITRVERLARNGSAEALALAGQLAGSLELFLAELGEHARAAAAGPGEP